MIYLDTSVVLAHLLVGNRRPPPSLWREALFSSRLLEYEVWCRLHGRGYAATCGDHARELLARVAMIELSPLVLDRVLEPFPLPLRTLDALHLASLNFLRERRLEPRLASYDRRMLQTAQAMGIPILDMD